MTPHFTTLSRHSCIYREGRRRLATFQAPQKVFKLGTILEPVHLARPCWAHRLSFLRARCVSPAVSAIPTKLKVFRRPPQRADIFGVMSAHKPPAENDLRNEIREVLDKITDSETLLFCLWMFKKIANHEELPPPEELKALQGAFVRMPTVWFSDQMVDCIGARQGTRPFAA